MNSTCDENGLVAVEDALQALLAQVSVVKDVQYVELNNALHCVLAEDITAQVDVPSFDASVMDGYAINSNDIGRKKWLPVVQRIAAGQASSVPLESGCAARIFTGAPLPEGADTVVAQEVCRVDGDSIALPADIKPHQFVRVKGCHVKQGSVVLAKGTRLGAAEIGLAASVGIDSLPVYRRLKVALLTTGDELVEPGLALQAGQIYNANQHMLSSLLSQFNCDVVSVGPIADEVHIVRKALIQSAESCDLILSSGGVSVGEEDHVRAAVDSLGKIAMWRIRLKPGKPLAFGYVRDRPFIGLPGNPVSSFVTFCLFARPFILKSQGVEKVEAKSFPVAVDFEQMVPDKRRNYQRVNLIVDEHGRPWARPYPSQDSATLLSTTATDGLLCVPEEMAFERGTVLMFTPFSELLN